MTGINLRMRANVLVAVMMLALVGNASAVIVGPSHSGEANPIDEGFTSTYGVPGGVGVDGSWNWRGDLSVGIGGSQFSTFEADLDSFPPAPWTLTLTGRIE